MTRRSSVDPRRLLLKASAYLLGYPDEGFEDVLAEMRPDLERLAHPAARHLIVAIDALRTLDPDARMAAYVATFDFSEARSLYVTAHELGDSRRRGQALLDLRAMLRAAGFESPANELPDYLPMLLEFVAAAPSDVETATLERRLAAVCAEIVAALVDDDPYRAVLDALALLLPAADAAHAAGEATRTAGTRSRARFPLREQADTAEMPYPLRYQD